MNLINAHSKILIIGDSWGCGEWEMSDAKVYSVVHPGLELYLKEYGCDVTNISAGDSSNHNIFNRLHEHMQKNNSYDVILWFQTDPLRSLRPYAANIEIFKKNKEDFILAHDELLDSIYDKFNSMDLPIYCLGGTTKLNLTLLEKYPNLYPVIPSIIEMFGEAHVKIWPSDWIRTPQVLESLSHSTVDYLYSECNLNLSKEWFFPDGRHPNRKAHKKIFEYLIDFKVPAVCVLPE
jgi:hypothetical protein